MTVDGTSLVLVQMLPGSVLVLDVDMQGRKAAEDQP
jgi:hypothetical protein